MSYSSAKRTQLSKEKSIYAWWYCDNVSEVDMQPFFTPYARNFRIDWQSVVIRPWHDLYATLTAGSAPKGIWSYLRTVPANNRLVVRHNVSGTEKLCTIDSSAAVVNITTASDIASNNKMRFVNVWDVVYTMNWSDYYWKLDWTTYTVPNVWIATFAPAFWVVFNSSIFVAGWASNPNKVYKSVWDNYQDFNSAGSDTFTFQEQITWLSANSEALFYFTKNTISVTGFQDITDTAGTITYVTRPLTVKEWANNHDCIAELGHDIYYLTSSNSINKIARGNNINWFEVQELSDRPYAGITKILWSLDKDQSNSFAVVYPNEMLIKWFLYSQWSTYSDICIVYDTITDTFQIDEQKYFSDWVYFEWNSYTTSAIEPKVYIDEYWQTDDDTPIPFEYWTKNFYVWTPTGKNILWESRSLVDINNLAWLTQEIWVEWGKVDEKMIDSDNIPLIYWWIGTVWIWEFAIWEDGEDYDPMDEWYNEVVILRTKWNLNVKGKKVQWRYTNNTLAGKVRLKHIEAKVEVLPYETTNLTT